VLSYLPLPQADKLASAPSGKNKMTRRITLSSALLVSFAALYPWAPVISAQDPIRVESHQVLVPAVVFNQGLYSQLENMNSLNEPNLLAPQLREAIAVRNLVAVDFQLFEDGKEQSIQNVTLERPALSIVRDNMGIHFELIGRGGGRWADPDQPKTVSYDWTLWPRYVISYVPPPSLEGSCHQIKVKVKRRDLFVWSRSEYCNTPHSPSDPLKGTEFGTQMEDDVASANSGKIDLTLQAVPFLVQAGTARVYVKLEFPWKSLAYEVKDGILHASIGALIMVYNEDGTLVARFSDFACCDNDEDTKSSAKPHSSRGVSTEHTSQIPDRYETQIDLPPGEYQIRAILSDGEKFGRQQVPLALENHDDKQLATSAIFLSKRIRAVPPESLASQGGPSGGYLPLVSKGIEITPTTDTRFKKDESLYAYFEVYDPQLAAKSVVSIEAHLRILDARTGAVRKNLQSVNAAPYVKAGNPVIPIGRGISLKNLSKGAYRLEIRASNSTGKSTPWRAANFTIE
jgi:hypothetical protein